MVRSCRKSVALDGPAPAARHLLAEALENVRGHPYRLAIMRTGGWAATALVGCLSACIVACGSSAGGDQASAPRPHGSWILGKVVDNGRPMAVPASADVYLIFTKQRPQVRGFDGCGSYSGTLEPAAGGAWNGAFAISGNGCLSLSKTLDAVGRDLDVAFFRDRPSRSP